MIPVLNICNPECRPSSIRSVTTFDFLDSSVTHLEVAFKDGVGVREGLNTG